MSLQTPLNKVRGLGSAKDGTEHFWLQRVTALANVPLTLFLVWTVLSSIGADYAEVRTMLASPVTAVAILLLMLSGAMHMRLGMQVIIEDYVHNESAKVLLLILNTFFAILVAVTCVYAIMKISLGA